MQKCVDEIGLESGVVHVFIPHATAGVTINENADPDVTRDVMYALERAVPNEGFAHFEGNSDAHTKAQLTGFETTLIVRERQAGAGNMAEHIFL